MSQKQDDELGDSAEVSKNNLDIGNENNIADDPPLVKDSIPIEIVNSNLLSPIEARIGFLTGEDSSPENLLLGIGGLAVFASLLAAMLPLGIGLLNAFDVTRPPFVGMMLIAQTLFLPPMIGFAFAAVTPMFWYGSISLRFLLASLAVTPSCIVFYVLLNIVQGSQPKDFLSAFFVVMFASLVAIAAVALAFQLWSPWTLTHRKSEPEEIPPTGIRSLIELTVIVAIGCAILTPFSLAQYVEGFVSVGGVAALAALATITTFIGFLRDEKASRVRYLLPVVISLVAAALFNGFMAYVEFGRGRNVFFDSLLYIVLLSIYGAALLFGLTWLLLRWIRYCDWRCVARKRAQHFETDSATNHPLE